jgi:hypothetical protein
MLARVLLLYAKVLFFKANARTAAFDYANAVGHGCLISAGCHILPAMLLRKASRSPTGFIEPCRPIEGYKAAVRPAVGSGDEARRLPPHVRLEGSRVRCFTRGGYDCADHFLSWRPPAVSKRDRSPAPRQIVPNKNIRSVIRQNIGVARQKLSQ